jgi:alkanesulfonate monooxygenase SsuD/methylene tetrahydromethanopterin reductase-like flavin-dependent oxidoreductase (luciferase family)
MLGDVRNWQEIEEMGSIIVGSPETVRRRLWEYVKSAHAGIFLIQFHVGNLSYDLTLKSQRLFATQVMPELRHDSARLFAEEFPELERLEAVR